MKKLIVALAIGLAVIIGLGNFLPAYAVLNYDEIITGNGSPGVLVIVKSNIYEGIKPALNQYVADLSAEGYKVTLMKYASGTAGELRDYIKSRQTNLQGAVLIGQLPVAMIKISERWSNFPEITFEKIPADIFFMDLNSTWTDSDTDGAYDTYAGDELPEIYVARLDTPVIGDEVALLNNYFRKNHAYRRGEFLPVSLAPLKVSSGPKALVYIDENYIDYAAQIFNQLYPDALITLVNSETTAQNYKNTIGGAGIAGYESLELRVFSPSATQHVFQPGGQTVTAQDIQNLKPMVDFYGLNTPYVGNYTQNNYLAGKYVFSENYGLAALTTTKLFNGYNPAYFYPALGYASGRKNLGEAFKTLWKNQHDNQTFDPVYFKQLFYGLVLVGDPTLTIDPPIAKITSEIAGSPEAGAEIALTGEGSVGQGNIAAYSWRIEKFNEGELVDAPANPISTSREGKWTIPAETGVDEYRLYLKVKDNSNRWSSEDMRVIQVTPPEEPPEPAEPFISGRVYKNTGAGYEQLGLGAAGIRIGACDSPGGVGTLCTYTTTNNSGNYKIEGLKPVKYWVNIDMDTAPADEYYFAHPSQNARLDRSPEGLENINFFCITKPATALKAKFLRYDRGVSGTLTVGEPYGVKIAMLNTGSETWDKNATVNGPHGKEANIYRLGSWKPQDNKYWEVENSPEADKNRAALSANTAPGEVGIFEFTFKPTAEAVGSRQFKWKMVKEHSAWFEGTNNNYSSTGTLDVTVAAEAEPTPAPDKAELDYISNIPATMTAGQTIQVNVRIKNTGTSTWSRTADANDHNAYRLGTNSGIWSFRPSHKHEGQDRVWLSGNVVPGTNAIFPAFTITAPATAGLYTLKLGMVKEGVHWFNQGGSTGGSPNMVTKNITVTAEAEPPAPTPATPALATPILYIPSASSESQINVSWGNIAGEAGFEVQRSANTRDWIAIGTTTADITSYQDKDLRAATTYYYRVRAYDAAGNYSAYSNVDDGTTRPAAPHLWGLGDTGNPYSTPVYWHDVTGATSYIIYRNDRIRATVDPGKGNPYLDATNPNTSYTYYIVAYNNGGNSLPSNTMTYKTYPGKPAGFKADDGQNSSYLHWTNNSYGQANIEVWRKDLANDWRKIKTLSGTATSYTDNLGRNWGKYWYKVKACNSAGCTESDVDSAWIQLR